MAKKKKIVTRKPTRKASKTTKKAASKKAKKPIVRKSPVAVEYSPKPTRMAMSDMVLMGDGGDPEPSGSSSP